MADTLQIHSHKGPYVAEISDTHPMPDRPPEECHFIVDQKLLDLHPDVLRDVVSAPSLLLIDALEPNKSIEKIPGYVDHLVANGIRRNHTLVAIGGGIVQDITCFLAATMLRGVRWEFYPTTLLAQADSCIGSKSSINSSGAKNILGTFTPPAEVHICTNFLKTLEARELKSGVGEMIKVHAIAGFDALKTISEDYENLFTDDNVMRKYIQRSLEIKKEYIEIDEFDTGPRNIFNYGHCFGHAIEAATNFEIPHGIAITIGMDMANFVAMKLGLLTHEQYQDMHPVLAKNYAGYEGHKIDLDQVMTALSKDKKNETADTYSIIFIKQDGKMEKTVVKKDPEVTSFAKAYLDNEIG